MNYKKNIELAGITTGHVQGIAVDKDRKYMYYSFTTSLIKTDMEGNILGSVKGLAGHLGCIAYNDEDGRIYGSLEYKHDSIGTDILKQFVEHGDIDFIDGFYIVAFDVDKIDRIDMDAEKDGIMTGIYLEEVTADYHMLGHKYGCSGIDGVTFAPLPGCSDNKKYLYVAYGIYGDVYRKDNDYQIILRYDILGWNRYEKPLNQSAAHKEGPVKPNSKYFIYTGNTTFGIQNLEYDEKSGYMFAAVYVGKKEEFPNYPMFVIDMNKQAECAELINLNETGELLSLAQIGLQDEKTGIRGIRFPHGSTGIISLGDGHFYFSREFKNEDGWGTNIGLYKFDDENGFVEE